jgi:hypothetical protein
MGERERERVELRLRMMLETERSWDHSTILASCFLRVEVHGFG